MSAGLALLGLVLLVAAIFVAVAVMTHLARQQREVFVPLLPDQALQFATDLFPRATWGETTGPGELNRRRRHVATTLQYTVSVDATAVEGGSAVSLWLSGWTGNRVGMNNAPSALLQLARLQRRIEAYSSELGFAPDGTPVTSTINGAAAAASPAALPEASTPFGDLGSQAHLDEMIRRAGYRGHEDRTPE